MGETGQKDMPPQDRQTWIKPVSVKSRLDGKEIRIQGIKEDMKSRIRVHDECEEMVLEKKKRG